MLTYKLLAFAVGATAVLGRVFDGFHGEIAAVLDVIAVATIAGTALVYSRVKAALLVSESAVNSWREEAAAQKQRADRNNSDLQSAVLAQTELIAKVAALEQRPDLSKLESLVAEGTDSMKKHEVAAGQRTDRLIATLEARLPPKQEAA